MKRIKILKKGQAMKAMLTANANRKRVAASALRLLVTVTAIVARKRVAVAAALTLQKILLALLVAQKRLTPDQTRKLPTYKASELMFGKTCALMSVAAAATTPVASLPLLRAATISTSHITPLIR